MTSRLPNRLSRRTKILYGAGDFGFAMTDAILGILFAIFLTDVVGLAPGLAAVAVFVGRSFDYINDPLSGYLSDRTRTRWGRRRPFLLFGFVPYALAFVLLWWQPPIESTLGLVAYYALAYMLYDAAATFVYMPYYALTPELTPEYDERTTLTSYRMAFSIVGGLVAGTVFVSALLTLPFWEWAARRWDKRRAYIAGMLFLSVVMVALILVRPGLGTALVLGLAVLAGIGVAAVHVLPWSVIPDAVEWDEARTGERHEGMFYSLVTLLRKVSASLALPAVLLVLQWSGYVANTPLQPASAVRAIQLLTGAVPAVFFGVGILFALVYPLGRDVHAALRAQIAARRAERVAEPT